MANTNSAFRVSCRICLKIQQDLFKTGAEIASLQTEFNSKIVKIEQAEIEELENNIDAFAEQLPELTNFILPDGNLSAAHLHHARTICRRVERELVSLGKEKVISQKPGLNSGSSWSSTGKEIALTMSYEGNPEIYVMSPSGEDIRRLTQDMSLDVEPTWSPDGERLVFSSGRSPLAHLYVMNKEGGDIKRLTFAGKFNAAPSWSPKGDKIVFAGQLENHFDLFMVGSEGGNLARLTKAMKRENNEHPSWSANGRHIVFSSNRNGRGELYVIDDDGGNERPLLQKFGNISSPEWSSYLE